MDEKGWSVREVCRLGVGVRCMRGRARRIYVCAEEEGKKSLGILGKREANRKMGKRKAGKRRV